MKNKALRRAALFLFLAAGLGGGGRDLAAMDPAVPLGRYRLDLWRPADGLPQSTVTAVLQTRSGRLYLGTGGGLARFDGVRFQTFSSGAFEGETHDITGLFEDGRGVLWIRLNTGLARLDPAAGRVIPVPLPHPARIRTILDDPAGRLWLETYEGLYVSAGETFRRLDGPGAVLFAAVAESGIVVLDMENGLWRGDAGGLRLAVSWKTLGFERAVSAAAAGRGWVLATDRGIAFLEEAAGKYAIREISVPRWDRARNIGLYRDRADRLWLATDDLVRCLLPGASEWITVLSGLGFGAPAEDRGGVLWISTPGELVRILPGGTIRPERLRLADDEIYGPPYEDRLGNIWVGLRHGLARLRDPRVISVAEATDGTPLRIARHLIRGRNGEIRARFDDSPRRVYVLKEDRWSAEFEGTDYFLDRDGVAWLFDSRYGLKRIMPDGTILPFRPEARAWGVIQALARDHEGTAWLGTPDGLVRWDEKRPEIFRTADGLPQDHVRDLLVDRDGALWIAASRGVSVRRAGRFSRIGPESLTVMKFLLDRDGVVWMAATEGLFRFAAGELKRLSARDGLADDAVFSLQQDTAGDFWLSYRRGLMRVAKSELEAAAAGRGRIRPQLFDRSDGMVETEANASSQSTLIDVRGRVWFCTMGGAVFVDPAKLAVNRNPPPVDIESVRADGVERPGADLRLPPGTRRVDFRFTAADFENPKNVRFAFRLEGYGEPWTETDGGSERAVSYTNLKPGSYRFHVRASNSDGFWNQDGATVTLAIEPFFWQTTLFRVAAAGLLLAFAVAVLRVLKKFLVLLAFFGRNRLVGSYVLDEVIGNGSTSTVYRAHHWLSKKTTVAVKILKPERVGSRADVKRFKREGALIDMLETPHLVGVLARGEHAGTFTIVMEYLRGRTLAERLKSDPPLDRRAVLSILRQLAEVLDEIHRCGVVHRDLKPANIMLAEGPGRSDFVKLLDFGVATGPVPEAEGESRFFSGTLAYMAPEQTLNRETPAADVYSLGMIAYELLAGERPFRSCRPHELLDAILHRKPEPIRTIVPDLPARLADMIMAMLEKNPADRPPLDRIIAVFKDENPGFRKSPGV